VEKSGRRIVPDAEPIGESGAARVLLNSVEDATDAPREGRLKIARRVQRRVKPQTVTRPGGTPERRHECGGRRHVNIHLLPNQLNPIPERIMHMTTPHPRNIVRLVHRHSRISQRLHQRRIVTAPQRRMRLLRRSKIIFHSKMDLHLATLKPATAASRKLRWLGHLLHPQQPAIKSARPPLFAGRHRELHMINSGKR
jgi:hypothetical protein